MKYFIFLNILAVILLPSELVIITAPIILIIYSLLDNSFFYLFKRKALYILFLIVVVIQPLLLSDPSESAWYFSDDFLRGLAMFFRAIVVISSIKILNKSVDKMTVKLFWRKNGLTDFENVFNKTEEILPLLKDNMRISFEDIRRSKSKSALYKSPAEYLAKLIVPFLHRSNTLISGKNFEEV